MQRAVTIVYFTRLAVTAFVLEVRRAGSTPRFGSQLHRAVKRSMSRDACSHARIGVIQAAAAA
eukprot:4258962-Pleurochrysis_carterae.AAC.1